MMTGNSTKALFDKSRGVVDLRDLAAVSSARRPASNRRDSGRAPTSIIQLIWDRIRYRLVLQSVSDMLDRMGIAIVPYYVFEESIADKLALGLDIEPGCKPVTFGFLSNAEIEALCLQAEHWDLATEKAQLEEGSARCFALKHKGEIAAYEVCNLRECDSRLITFPLKEDEVYLSGMYTLPAYRGKNLAAVIECELYKELYAMGREKYYSINILFNKPSLRFKEKLRARPARLNFYLGLFSKWRWTIGLKKYTRRQS
jgi:GNAT superfamily N-acetyltransferase